MGWFDPVYFCFSKVHFKRFVIMKAKFGAIVTSGSGKLGGHVFQGGIGGSRLRSNNGKRNVKSANQMSQRNIFLSVVRAWKSISEPARVSWLSNAFENSIGFACFVSVNIRRRANGLPISDYFTTVIGSSLPSLFAFITAGESNSDGFVNNSFASVLELSAFSDVQLWDNVSNSHFIDSHPGTNSLDGHRNLESYTSTHHGWDLGLNNLVRSAIFPADSKIFSIHAGQGGSVIANWVNSVLYLGVNCWNTMLSRVANAFALLPNGYNIKPIFLISLGINDSLASLSGFVFESKLTLLLLNIRAIYPSCIFCITLFPSTTPALLGISNAIDRVCTDFSNSFSIPVSDLAISSNHWSYASQKEIIKRMLYAVLSLPLPPSPFFFITSATLDYSNFSLIHIIFSESLPASPSTAGLTINPSSSISSSSRNSGNYSQLDVLCSSAFSTSSFITLSYAPGSIVSESGKSLSFASYLPCTNTRFGNFLRASVTLDGSGIYLVSDSFMSSTSALALSWFKVSGHTVTNVVKTGPDTSKYLLLTLAEPITASETDILISYQTGCPYILTGLIL
jgi:hypothetical protein